MSTAKELRELNPEDLNRRAAELRENLFQDRMKMKTGTLQSPQERTKHRRELARILTLLTEKQTKAQPSKTSGVTP